MAARTLPDPAAPAADDALPKTPSFRLDGKRALVTGASRGLGRACAAALAEAGARVVLAARGGDALARVAGEIEAAGGSADTLPLDIADVERAAAALAALGPVDILVNNAGGNRPAALLDVTVDDFDAVMGINVRGAYFCAQAVARQMVAAKRGGVILNMSSQMGHVGGPRRTVYCASKHAIEGMTKAMAMDLAPHGIRVNAIAPTFISTPMTRPFLDNPAFREDTLKRIALGRLGELPDVMGAVVFLASDAARLITGTSLLIDGGWTAQ